MNSAQRDDPRLRPGRTRLPHGVVLAVSGLLVGLLVGCSPMGSKQFRRPGRESGVCTSHCQHEQLDTVVVILALGPVGDPRTLALVGEPHARPALHRGTTAPVPRRLSLVGRRGSAFAFAPLDRPADVTVEGRVSVAAAAWSTSKVLIVAAYLDTAVDGRPERITAANRRLITDALTRSDEAAVKRIRNQIGARPGPAMTSVLRSIGDKKTRAPNSYLGTMVWSIREQVRFMAALEAGRVVSPDASRFLLKAMRPMAAHSWGLGRIGATAYKGGWLRANTATRQLGIVDGFAVAVITTTGPAVRQNDGDAAHVKQMNRLAGQLQDRLAYEKACR